ncbi:putative high affinity methionine permease [Diaporthe ampelina]|uniref:Putative high affinity methionine permease n=1 Tax=Diaporthe ampelina TaxID=1214573 RepID=A0A0G2H9X5_9PEZI|nr:putative high affinity methionine permease [Diaporthe ampelina]
MVSWRKPFSGRSGADVATADNASQVSDGSITYVGEKGGNNAAATYQEASGAPVERDSPLGYAVGPLTILGLNISMMIGTGIYSTQGTDWQVKGVALAGYTVAILSLTFHTKFSYYMSNAIGVVKILTLLFVIVTGFVVLGGNTKIENPTANFKNPFHGTETASAYGLTNALYRIIFSYGGYNNAFNVANEVKNPVKSLRKYAFLALLAVYVLYMLANVAYFSAVAKYDLVNSGTTVATLFFRAVFGDSGAVRGLNFLVALSAFGNILASALGSSRMIRECGRQGVLPWTNFWVTTKPFGTPIGPYFVKWALTALMILALPAGDAFNFVSDLSILPSAAFNLAMAVGLYVVRWRRRRANLPPPEFKAWHSVVIFNILVQLYLLVMPWYPPAGGQYAGDVSFWYATYAVTGVGILIACGTYYWFWAKLIPQWKGYQLRQEVIKLDNGAQTHEIKRVPNDELAEFDATHDAAGRLKVASSVLTDQEKAGSASDDGEAGKTTTTQTTVLV